MAESQHHDPIQDNIETHPVQLAIGVAVGAIALVVGIILLVQFAIGAYGGRSLKDDPSMAPNQVAKRIAPVAKLEIDPNAPAAPPASAPVAVAAVSVPSKAGAAPAKGDAGKSVYDMSCAACHASGLAGAPKMGDKAAWAARSKGGKDALYAAVLKGKGAMPPKGGSNASEADIKAAVDYMLGAAK